MSPEDTDENHKIVVARLTQRLHGYAQGMGLTHHRAPNRRASDRGPALDAGRRPSGARAELDVDRGAVMGMSDDTDLVLEAVAVLRACGYIVEPWSNDFPYWLVDGETVTDGELLALAHRLGLMSSSGQLQ